MHNKNENDSYHSYSPLKFLLAATLFCIGTYAYIPGPTLIDLAAKVNESITTLPLIFTARALGYVSGCIVGSFIFQWLLHSNQKSLFIFLMAFLFSTTLFATSLNLTLGELFFTFCAGGFFMGMLDSGFNVYSLPTLFDKISKFCHVMYLFHALGGFTATLIARSFVSAEVNVTLHQEYILYSPKVIRRIDYITHISYSYVIISALTFLVCLLWLMHYFFGSYRIPKSLELKPQEGFNRLFRNLNLLNAFLLSFFTQCIGLCYAEMLPAIYVFSYHTAQTTATDTLSIFLGCNCLGRALTMYFANKFPSYGVIFLGILLALCGNLLMFYDSRNATIFWVANAIIGLGVSPIFPCLYLWLIDKILFAFGSLNPMFVASTVVQSFVPWLISSYFLFDIERIKPFILSSSLLCVIFAIVQYLLFYGLEKNNQLPNVPAQINEPLQTNQPTDKKNGLQSAQEETLKKLLDPKRLPEVPQNESQKSIELNNPKKIFENFDEVKRRIDKCNKGVVTFFQGMEYKINS